MKLVVKIALGAAGLLLFAAYLREVDTGGMGAVFQRLGPWLPLVLLPYALVYGVDTWAWRCAFATAPAVNFGRLFRIRWAGEAVSNVVPSAYLGGEFVKIYLLGQRGASRKSATAAAVVSKSAQTLGQLVLIAAAGFVFWQLAPGQPGLRLALATICVGGFAALAAIFWLQRRGLLASLLGWTKRLSWQGQRFQRWRAAAAETDRVTGDFYRQQPGRFLAASGLYLGGWLLDTFEIFLFAWLAGHPISWPQALVVEAFTGIAKAVGWMAPGSIGVQESGIVFFGRLAGLPDSLCVAYALFRRGREACYALVGWAMLAIEEGGLAALRRRAVAGPDTESTANSIHPPVASS
jgi:uncharacterized protein (TIRG00374 family)